MGLLKKIFGADQTTSKQEQADKEEKDFDMLKYDGVRALKSGQSDYAVKCFQAALELKEDLEVRDYLSQAFIHMDEMQLAFEQLQKLSQAQPDNKQIWMHMSQVAYMMEAYDAMAEACQKGMALDEKDYRLPYFYSQACIGKGDLITGIAMLTKSLSLEDNVHAHLLRGETLLKMGDVAGADEDALWLLDHLEESNDETLLLKARILTAQGKVDDAIIYYNKVVNLNPFCAVAYKERGALYLAKGDKEKAEEDMRQFLEVSPKEVAAVTGEYKAEGKEHCSSQQRAEDQTAQ